jgi:hypothetical protein
MLTKKSGCLTKEPVFGYAKFVLLLTKQKCNLVFFARNVLKKVVSCLFQKLLEINVTFKIFASLVCLRWFFTFSVIKKCFSLDFTANMCKEPLKFFFVFFARFYV